MLDRQPSAVAKFLVPVRPFVWNNMCVEVNFFNLGSRSASGANEITRVNCSTFWLCCVSPSLLHWTPGPNAESLELI